MAGVWGVVQIFFQNRDKQKATVSGRRIYSLLVAFSER